MATNSKKLPRGGLGAPSVTVPVKLSQQAPKMDIPKPVKLFRVICSFKKKRAATATKSGSMAAIIPAWDAEVFSKALASTMKYRQGSQNDINRIYLRLPFSYPFHRSRFAKK